jgi:hypothetical protein
MPRLAVLVLAALAFLPAASAGTAASGLFGTVKKGPITPVCHTGVPCDAPAHVSLTFTRAGTSRRPNEPVRVRVTTSKSGRYRVALEPGFYTVSTGRTTPVGRPITPHAVHVRSGHWDRIDFLVDTGIR